MAFGFNNFYCNFLGLENALTYKTTLHQNTKQSKFQIYASFNFYTIIFFYLFTFSVLKIHKNN
jgi:hypothetical protein